MPSEATLIETPSAYQIKATIPQKVVEPRPSIATKHNAVVPRTFPTSLCIRNTFIHLLPVLSSTAANDRQVHSWPSSPREKKACFPELESDEADGLGDTCADEDSGDDVDVEGKKKGRK